MGTFELIIAIVVALVLVAIVVAAAWTFSRRRRTERLHRRFGPEYEHAVTTLGDRRRAEAELADREKRAKSLQIRPLGREEVEHFSGAWQGVRLALLITPLRPLPMLRILWSK